MSNPHPPRHGPLSVHLSILLLRVTVGIIFMAHGAQKLFGLFGGKGLAATVDMMGPLGYLVTIGEFFGGAGLIFGFLTRFSAASLTVIMIGAIMKVHGQNGFFLPRGMEYNIALIGMLVPLFIMGPGRLAVARYFASEKAGMLRRAVAVVAE